MITKLASRYGDLPFLFSVLIYIKKLAMIAIFEPEKPK